MKGTNQPNITMYYNVHQITGKCGMEMSLSPFSSFLLTYLFWK